MTRPLYMQISRRALIGGVGAVTGVGLLSSATASAAPSVLLPRAPSSADWAALDREVAGAVLLPGSAAYADRKLLFSTRYDAARPAAVVQATSQSDIQKTVLFAARHGMRVTARSGGHSYVGASAADSTIVIDLRSYAWITYDSGSGRATVFAGAGLYRVHETLSRYGRTIPTGTCPTVGIAGLTLGGGLGVDSRAWGLTCDRLVSLTAVAADGRALTASPTSNPDLFWALRGGGGGANVLATAFTLQTHPTGSKGTYSVTFPASQAARVLNRWAGWIRFTYSWRWANARVESLANGSIRVRVLGVTRAGDERAAASDLIAAVGVAPTATSYQQLAYMDAVRYLGGGSTSPRQGFAAGSDVLWTMSDANTSAIVGAVAARSRAGGSGVAILDPLDAAVSRPAAGDTAFPWRDHTATVQWYVGVGSSAGYPSAYAWIDSAHRALGVNSAGAYVNYLEPGRAAGAYFRGNLARMQQVRRTYDPSRRIFCGVDL